MRTLLSLALAAATAVAAGKTNVIVVLSDDQGFGDFSAHGNPVLKTPHLDALRSQSCRLTDFHVAPMCTPTRGQLMTGCDALRNGAAAVCAGRAVVRPGFPFLSEAFKAGGYRTGLFGKWHLGENYPNRPNDKGFDDALYHRGWGFTSAPDAFNNDYFDPVLLRNGKPVKATGYCTDVFFDAAMSWMTDRAAKAEPFFCYLPTNAPHGPLWSKPADRAPYVGKPGVPAAFFGMIANLDHNVGRLMAFLDAEKLAENTVVVFFHDNGGTAGVKFFNAGLRGGKTTYYDGGHRAACFVRGPGVANRDVADLTQVQDLFPTLCDLCGVPAPAGATFDGVSLAGAIKGGAAKLPSRTLVVQYGESPGGDKLAKFHACVMRDAWRLVDGKELYNVSNDPGQTSDVASGHPAVVEQLRGHYEKWWSAVGPRTEEYAVIPLGTPHENPVALTCSDWAGTYADNFPRDVRGGLNKNGPWHVGTEAGDYRITLRRWPQDATAAMTAGLPPFKAREGQLPAGKDLPVTKVRLRIGGVDRTADVPAGATAVTFDVTLPKMDRTTLQSWMLDAGGTTLAGAYFAEVLKK